MPRLLSTPPRWAPWLNTSVSWATSSASTTIPVSAMCQVSGVTPLNAMVRSAGEWVSPGTPSLPVACGHDHSLGTPGYVLQLSAAIPLGSLSCAHVSQLASPLLKCL